MGYMVEYKGISGSGPEDSSLLSITATITPLDCVLLEAPDVSSWNSKDTDSGRKKKKRQKNCIRRPAGAI